MPDRDEDEEDMVADKGPKKYVVPSVENTEAGTITAARIMAGVPGQYRLARDPWGNLFLQGGYYWTEGNLDGTEWRTIPTVNI